MSNYGKKICIFADAHGNQYAFAEIMKSMMSKKPDSYIYCGDICGYYYGQNEIIRMLKKLERLECILGNHDRVFLDMIDGKTGGREYTEKYGKANNIFMKTATEESIRFLRKMGESLVLEVKGYEIGAFHGSPWNHLDEYIYPDADLSRFDGIDYDLTLLGHTHYPMDLATAKTRIINPGSCGQPRNSRPPSYALLELDNFTVEFVEVEYKHEQLVKDVSSHEEKNNYLIDVLTRDRKRR